MAANIHIDNEGIITFWDAGARELFGYEENEVLGKKVFILIPEELMEDARRVIKEAKETGIYRNYRTERLKKGGIRIKVEATLRALKDSGGSVTGVSLEVAKRS